MKMDKFVRRTTTERAARSVCKKSVPTNTAIILRISSKFASFDRKIVWVESEYDSINSEQFTINH